MWSVRLRTSAQRTEPCAEVAMGTVTLCVAVIIFGLGLMVFPELFPGFDPASWSIAVPFVALLLLVVVLFSDRIF